MDIKLFDGRILAPSKCGTRHLRKVFNDIRFDINVHQINSISHIVIRNPYEHFESAIHTEYSNYEGPIDNSHHIIYGAISENGIGHWNPNIYKFLYSVFLKNPKIEIIQLNELSIFLESIGHNVEFKKTDYDWSSLPNSKPKEVLINELKLAFKNEFDLIQTKLEIEFEFYTRLSSKSVISRIL